MSLNSSDSRHEILFEDVPAIETLRIDDALKAKLLDLALKINGDIYIDSFQARGDFLKACESLVDALKNSSIGPALEELKNKRRVALIIQNLPVDPELPEPPLDGGVPVGKKTFVSEAISAAIAQIVGYPSIIFGEKKEALIHQITPVPGRENTQSNEGAVQLGIHQDMAPNQRMPHFPYDVMMPDWLNLIGVQAGSEVTPTMLASAELAVRNLDLRDIEILQCENRFQTNPPDSFLKELGDSPENLHIPTHPVLVQMDGHYESIFDSTSGLRPVDPRDKEALRALANYKRQLAAQGQEAHIVPGTSVIFNNRMAAHWRGAVKNAATDGRRRWLQRTYVYDVERAGMTAMRSMKTLQLGGGLIDLVPLGHIPEPRMDELAGYTRRAESGGQTDAIGEVTQTLRKSAQDTTEENSSV